MYDSRHSFYLLFTTSAVIFNNTTGVDAFDFTVMVFVCIPFLPDVSKTTSRLPSPPGGTGLVLYLGTVQPQVVVADVTTKLAVPLFTKVKTYAIFSPSATFPKLCSYSLKAISTVPVSDCCNPEPAALFFVELPL
jgi:hypothetical protein